MVDKNTLRKVYLEKRLTLSAEEYQRRNKLLIDRLIEYIDFTQVNFLHTFLSITDKYEVDTFSVIKIVRELNPDINIVICKTLPKGELSHYKLNDRTRIEKNKWGIPEPVEGDIADIEGIDLVLVPLICFDKVGHRVGYGKGFYDRFLKKVPKARKVGLALTPPLDIIKYSDEMDVRLNMCVSPFETYEF
ncbi:5-formyltetrahydrofolate cyclo-ligase [Fulvivirga sp. 29W222]|uniref:5-formyltetrahydrofolate cyclo-ligase n=1 Tax=Fulvivirga marina TaxID=2494733 RepID=A0A937KA99_9BACT|nr:5-formyltetrahydrofolate cyclo-ligase [Fulvivirga marina]MBL6444961.1 5-formyltetrahydrofolate cyclo-ligase [Fulvivirga marina]